LPPRIAAWWLEALSRVQQDEASRARLHANAGRFRAALAEVGINAGGCHYVVPILVGEDGRAFRAATSLQNAGYDIRAIRPPSVPEGSARLRVSIHANHTPETLVAAAGAIAQALADGGFP
jgi:8-amino-7-oxononanoate synthase